MACLLFSTVRINFMPQFIPGFAASKAFKSYLAASLCSVTRLLVSLWFTCERRLRAGVVNFVCYICRVIRGTVERFVPEA